MIDLEQQIRGYYEAIIDPVDVEAVTATDAVSVRSDGSWWRGPLVAVAAAVAIVVAVSAAVLVLRGGPDTVVEPTTETVAPAPETTVSGLSFEWSRVTLPGMPSRESMPSDESTVAAFDGGLVVAAHNHVWMSPDGVNWTMTNTFPASGEVRDLYAGGPGLVAVTAGWAAGSGPVRILTSTDGIAWTPADLAGSSGTLRAVAGRGTDLVAVGRNFVATSSDGVTWTGTSLLGQPEAGNDVWLHDVTVGGPGFVAVGGSEEDGWSAAWTSQDGTTWSKHPFGPTSGSWMMTEMKAITTGGPGFVAVGHGPYEGPDGGYVFGASRAWVWTSPDGFTWTRAPHIPDLSIAVGLRDVATYGDTLVAVGSGTEGAAAVFTSTDGITWQQLPHDDLFTTWAMSSVVQYGDILVAAGGDSVWIGTPTRTETRRR